MAMSRMRLIALVVIALASCSGNGPGATPSATSAPTARPSPTSTRAPDPFALAQSYEANSVSELADRLIEAETAIRAGGDIAERARVQQAAYRQLVVTPSWRDETYELLPSPLVEDARANVQAGAELRALTQAREELPPWRIVKPPSAAALLGYYQDAGRTSGIDWQYLAAIHLSETRMGRIRGTSIAGAKGPMQFLPSTWAAYGKGNIDDPRDAVAAAARYLKAHGAPANMPRALFAYNHSDHYVKAITLYAGVMRRDPRTYHAYHAWQVYYRTTAGDALLYEGWPTR